MPARSAPYRPEAPIAPELAAGAVLFNESGKKTLLLHHQEDDRWCFPKGHIDTGESLEEAAVREIREETGLTVVRLGPEVDEVSYRFYSPRLERNVHKTVIYFLAYAKEEPAHPESLFDRAEWVPLSAARRQVKFATDRHVLDTLQRARPSKKQEPSRL